jgi:hypothetical protein
MRKLPLTLCRNHNSGDNNIAEDVLDDVELENVRRNKRKQTPELLHGNTTYTVLSTRKGSENVDDPASACLQSSFRSRRSHRKAAGRKIHFNEMAMVIWIESIDDMTDEEFDASFFAPQDYLAIREREKVLFRQISTLGMIRSPQDDCLGLETRVQRYQRKGRSRESIYAVIFEQEMNRDFRTGVCNDCFLAQIYQPFAQIAAQMARDRATRNTMRTASICDPNRFVDVINQTSDCNSLNLRSDEQMEEMYRELKGAVEHVQDSVYKGMMKYAVACIPPSPATLRLGHGRFLEMSEKEEEQPWPQQPNLDQEADCFDDGYGEDGEEKKSGAPSRQEMIRHSFDPPRFPQCRQEHYHAHMKAQRHQYEMARKQQTESRWIADQQSHDRDEPQPVLAGTRAHPGWVWNPALCDFVPIPTASAVSWNT